MAVKHILGALAFIIFFCSFHYFKDKKRSYVLLVVCLFPLMELHITNEQMGLFTVFDAITYYVVLYYFKDFVLTLRYQKVYVVLFVSLSLVLIIGALQSEFLKSAFLNAIRYISVFFYAKLLIDACRADQLFAGLIVKCLKFVCLFSIAFLIVQMIFGLKVSFYPELNPNTQDNGMTRYPSFFFDAQVYAQFLAMTVFFFLINQPHAKSSSMNKLLFFCVVIVIFFTGGRAGLMGLCAGMIIIFLSASNKFRLFTLLGCSLIFFAISLYPEIFVIFNRDEGVNDSLDVRSQIWKEGYQVFLNNPLWGTGIGEFQNNNVKHFNFRYYMIDNEPIYYGTESGYLNILAECGLLAFVLIFILVFIPLITAIRGYIKKEINYNIFFIVASVFAWLTAFSTSNTLDDKRIVILLGTLLSLLVASSSKFKSSSYVVR